MLLLDSLLLWISDSLLCMHSPTHPPQSILSYSDHLPQKLTATPTPATGQMNSEEICHLPWWWPVQVWAKEDYRGFQRDTFPLLLGMIISTHGEWEWLVTLSSISGWCKRSRMKKQTERQSNHWIKPTLKPILPLEFRLHDQMSFFLAYTYCVGVFYYCSWKHPGWCTCLSELRIL